MKKLALTLAATAFAVSGCMGSDVAGTAGSLMPALGGGNANANTAAALLNTVATNQGGAITTGTAQNAAAAQAVSAMTGGVAGTNIAVPNYAQAYMSLSCDQIQANIAAQASQPPVAGMAGLFGALRGGTGAANLLNAGSQLATHGSEVTRGLEAAAAAKGC
ncbi:hypothetical protein FHS89_003040 [Rubricella aquisinus]|uniref:Uncharacterized protein n=1 Tax=Rubricella aquisinus TaxID=2028108 RepID=A0A840X5C6_9RHOB|nr:hypothetical protein [Rubricella aquisinus]MBB5516996.1 hypothetical protein [Rubricella aquisinus]